MEIDKILKPKKVLLIIWLILGTIAAILVVTPVILDMHKYDGVQMHIYNDLISNNKDKENMLVKLTITDLPYLFATKRENNTTYKYYFAFDENDYMYIVRLTDKTYNNMKTQYNSDKEHFEYTLKGYIFNDPAELKRLAISSYNKGVEDDSKKLDYSNFSSYLGNTYLDETLTPNDDLATVFLAFGVILAVAAFTILVVYITQTTKLKSMLKKYDVEEIKDELSNIDMSQYKKQSVYLTNKYIISTMFGLDIVEYSDVVWTYNEKRKRNGILIGIFLIVRTANKKRIQIANTKRDEDILIEIMSKIKEKNNNVLVGFTPENRKEYKELINNK